MMILALGQFLVALSILPLLNINFYLANQAALNIGITQTVHTLQTFFTAVFFSAVFTAAFFSVVFLAGAFLPDGSGLLSPSLPG